MYENHFGDTEYFQTNTKESNFKCDIDKIYTLKIDNKFSLRFTILENNSYSTFMIRLDILAFDNVIRSSYMTVEDIYSINDELQAFINSFNKKYVSLCLSYVLLPCNSMDGILYIGKDDECGDNLELGFVFNGFTFDIVHEILPRFTFIVNINHFADIVYQIYLRLPYF